MIPRNKNLQVLTTGLALLLPVCLLLYLFLSPFAGFLLAAVSLPMLAVRTQAMIYRDIRSLTKQVDSLMSGASFDKSSITREGDLMALYARLLLLGGRLQSAAEQKQRDKQAMRSFLEDVAHQLKTPLASLRLKLESREMAAPEPWLTECIAPVDRMTFLIQSLLTIARLEAGALQMAFVPAKVDETIQKASGALSETFSARKQKTVVSGEKNFCFRHDPRWLMEALENIIKNASAHSPEGSEIDIEYILDSQEAGTFLHIRVLDRGEGIPKDELPKIFDRFYQGTAGRKTEGTGIGLALAKAIVTAHHGDIRAMNRQGGGTEFLILLPVLSGSIKENVQETASS